jgi:hypothetical protein
MSKAQMLTGSWKSVSAADDVNNNGTWDASESINISDDTVRMVFNANGTGQIIAELPAPVACNWNLQNGDSELRIIIPSMADTSVARILSLSSTDLVTKNDTSKTRAFIAFKKQ